MKWVLGEALSNVLSGTSRGLAWGASFLAFVGLVVVLDLLSVGQLVDRAHEFRASGASILTVQAPALIDGAACESLARTEAVNAAGAVRNVDGGVSARALPGGAIPLYEVTPSFGRLVVSGSGSEAGLLVSEEVARVLGLEPGRYLDTSRGQALVGGSYPWPEDGRRSGFSYAVLSPVYSELPYDECWIEVWPPVEADMAGVLSMSLLPDRTRATPVKFSQVNPTLGRDFPGLQRFSERPTRLGGLATCAFGGILGWLAVRSRRLEFAAAAHVGVRIGARRLQVLIETACWVTGALVVLAGCATGLGPLMVAGLDDGYVRASAVHAGVPAALCTVIGAQVAVGSIRERHLFRYFKAR